MAVDPPGQGVVQHSGIVAPGAESLQPVQQQFIPTGTDQMAQ